MFGMLSQVHSEAIDTLHNGITRRSQVQKLVHNSAQTKLRMLFHIQRHWFKRNTTKALVCASPLQGRAGPNIYLRRRENRTNVNFRMVALSPNKLKAALAGAA